jgi:hypothetical protein
VGAGIILWPIDLSCHGRVVIEAAGDGRVVVCLGRVVRVVVDIGSRLTPVRLAYALNWGARLATMWRRLRKKHQDEYILCIIEGYIKKWIWRVPI